MELMLIHTLAYTARDSGDDYRKNLQILLSLVLPQDLASATHQTIRYLSICFRRSMIRDACEQEIINQCDWR